MFNKIKTMATGVANKVKGFVSAKETEMAAKAMEEEAALAANIEKIFENSGRSEGMELYHLFK